MPWNGSGTFNLDPSYSPEVAGTTIQPGRYNGLTGDIASGITNALAKDGQNTPTANLPMGAKKLTGLAAGSAAGDSVRYEQANVIGETSIAVAASTSDIFAAPTARVLITGTAMAIVGFPSSSLNTWKLVRFDGANILVNSTDLVCKGGANISTAAGDYAVILSVGTTAVVAAYFDATGDTITLNNLASATAAGSLLANGDYDQTWKWRLTTASKVGLTLTELLASTGAGSTLLAAVNLSGSTARPFVAQWTGTVNGQIGYSTAAEAQLTAPTLSGTAAGPDAVIAAGGAGTTTGTGGDVTITAGAGGSTSGAGGAVVISGGSAVGSLGGDVEVRPGLSSGATDGNVDLYSGLENTPISALRVVGKNGHIVFRTPVNSGNRPAITSGGGTGATITGSDTAFKVTLGTSPSSTPIVVTFANGFNAAPVSMANHQNSASLTISAASTTTTVTLTPSGSWSAGHIIDCVNFGISLS